MTSVRTATEVNKLSFAKVVASTPEIPTSTPQETMANSTVEHIVPSAFSKHGLGSAEPQADVNKIPKNPSAQLTNIASSSGEMDLVEGLQKLRVGPTLPSLNVNGTNSLSTGPSSKVQTPSDDASQKGDSSSDLGTKPPSLDGKSITSGTTFNALDEKESLRPDDSASVQAAAEDDDAFSVRGSLIAGSRMGSEVAARFQRPNMGDLPPRSIPHQLVIAESGNLGIVTPQSASSEQVPVTDAKIALVSATSTPNGLYGQNPDEKLLEAMNSQKDRLFLLKLEESVIEFVQDSKEPFMDVPPSNSFCRMLTHKLADYYHMTHSFEAGAGSVRIFRTPFCRVPPSLASIPQIASTSSTPPPAFLPKRIMRRGDSDFGPGSAGYSKPTSEADSDGKDKAAANAKMSREEKEKAYNQARERIFGTASAETSAPDNEDGVGMSRTSSVSLRDKNNGGKKGRRRRDSDTFETRANYVAYAPAYGPSHQPTWVQPQYMPNVQQYNAPVQQQQYQLPMQPAYGVPNNAYAPLAPGNGYGSQYNNTMPSYPQPIGQPRYQPPVAPMAPVQYGAPMQSSPQQPQGWAQPQQQPPPPPAFNQSPYQTRAAPASQSQGGIPYAFGALPVNANPHDPKSQHPIPGSFNRHAFNPKTQSFVPGNGVPPMPSTAGPYNSYMPSQQGSPQLAAPHVNYSGYQAGPPIGPSVPYNSGGYNMMRQESNNSHQSMPSYHHPPPALQHGHVPHQLPPHPPAQGPPHMSNKPPMPQGPPMAHGQTTFNHLPTYGNPSSLPQKPTT